MTTPTPEQFLGTPSTEDEEDELPPGFTAAPHEVVEPWTIGAGKRQPDKWTVDPGTLWQIPPTDLTGYVQQIAADVRAIAEASGVLHTRSGDTFYTEPLIQSGQVSVPSPESMLGFTTQGAPVFDEEPLTGVSMVPVTAYDALRDDLEAEKQTLTELVEEIKGIVKPSSSKVSLEVKAAIERWANPVVEETAEGTSEGTSEGDNSGPTIENPQVSASAQQGTNTHTRTPHENGPDYCAECSEKAQDWVQWPCLAAAGAHEVAPVPVGAPPLPVVQPPAQPAATSLAVPAATDHVEAWRAYAREVQPEKTWTGMNRSQIRTALGIAQPVADPATVAGA